MHQKQLQATLEAYGLSLKERKFGVSTVGNVVCPHTRA
jgi:hypothetical protein